MGQVSHRAQIQERLANSQRATKTVVKCCKSECDPWKIREVFSRLSVPLVAGCSNLTAFIYSASFVAVIIIIDLNLM